MQIFLMQSEEWLLVVMLKVFMGFKTMKLIGELSQMICLSTIFQVQKMKVEEIRRQKINGKGL